MKALIVDDSRAMQRIVSGIMNEISFETVEAQNGKDALEKLEKEKFDVALVDWNMPVMNGIELIEQIRTNANFAHLKIVMVTSESETARMAEALEKGADEYILKPFTKEAVIDKLKMIGIQL